MWFCLVLSKTGKSFVTFKVNNEGEAIHAGQMACLRSGGQQYFTVEVPDKTPKDDIRKVMNYKMWEKYQIDLDDIGKRHYKGGL